jgi:hypothetical protein
MVNGLETQAVFFRLDLLSRDAMKGRFGSRKRRTNLQVQRINSALSYYVTVFKGLKWRGAADGKIITGVNSTCDPAVPQACHCWRCRVFRAIDPAPYLHFHSQINVKFLVIVGTKTGAIRIFIPLTLPRKIIDHDNRSYLETIQRSAPCFSLGPRGM